MKEEHRIILEHPVEIKKYQEYMNGGPMPNYFWNYIILAIIVGILIGTIVCYNVIGGI